MLISNGLINLEIKFIAIYLLYGLRGKTSWGNIPKAMIELTFFMLMFSEHYELVTCYQGIEKRVQRKKNFG